MAHRLAARILTTEKDSEMNQTTNINISCDHTSGQTNAQTTRQVVDIPPINQTMVQSRDIELTEDIEDQSKQIEFLETLVMEYQNNPIIVKGLLIPIIVKGLLICKGKSLMNLIKLATESDKVELVLDHDISCTTCVGTKYTYVSSILVTKGGKTQEFKIGYNEIYSKFLKYGINTKIVI